MSWSGSSALIASGVQGGGEHPAVVHDTLTVVLTIAGLGLAAVLVALWLRRRSRRVAPVDDQWRALAVMGELCPNGWQAQITLYGWGAPVPNDAPPSRAPLIELEWKQFDESSGNVTVARRAWAETIPQALQAMIDDRQADLTLEQIEKAAGEDVWPF
ncbi:MAG: hypothetical protein ACLQBB_11670 [Solirubrobacteraceae bacterium]